MLEHLDAGRVLTRLDDSRQRAADAAGMEGDAAFRKRGLQRRRVAAEEVARIGEDTAPELLVRSAAQLAASAASVS